MAGSLWARIALRLAAVFVVLVALAALANLHPTGQTLLSGLAGLALAAALALIGAAIAVQPLLLRLETLAATLPPAPGDELARVAAQLEALGTQAAAQADALRAAGRARRALIANVSHDLRTPLASVQGYLELLLLAREPLGDAQARAHLQSAVAQCERLTRLVEALFELSRLEADDACAQVEPFPLAELAHDVVQKFAGAAQRRAVTLDAACSDGALVDADVALVERALDELVDNALRHTPAGGRVTLEVDGRGPRATLAVQDDGCGIAAERLPQLLDHYDHSTRTGAGAAGAPGLGLAIARRIAALHGSPLRIESAPGRGTRVAFELERSGPRPIPPDPPRN